MKFIPILVFVGAEFIFEYEIKNHKIMNMDVIVKDAGISKGLIFHY